MIESLADDRDWDFWSGREGGSRVPGHKRQLTERQHIFDQHIFPFFAKSWARKRQLMAGERDSCWQDERGCPSATGYSRSTTTTEYQIAQHAHNEAHTAHYCQRQHHHHRHHCHHHALQSWLKYPSGECVYWYYPVFQELASQRAKNEALPLIVSQLLNAES